MSAAQRSSNPWGLWATLGLSAGVFGLFFLLQAVVVVGFVVARWSKDPDARIEKLTAGLETNGLCIAIATVVSGPACVALIALLTRLRRGPSITEYLALQMPARRAVGEWILVLAGFIICTDTLTWLAGRPVAPQFMISAYETAVFLPLLLLALIVIAPLFEEVFFRGFMFPGIRQSRLGVIGAILLTSLGWAALHLQYDLYGIVTIFVFGIVLGVARWKTGSTMLTFLMHLLSNMVATGELLVKTHF